MQVQHSSTTTQPRLEGRGGYQNKAKMGSGRGTRWYKEVDGEGKALPAGPRYQNRGCKAYELCAFNDGDRFSWMAQSQLISKVYLKKHPSLPYCYFLNAQDKKMVNDFKKARA